MSFVLIKASDYNVAEDDETIWIYNKKNTLCVRSLKMENQIVDLEWKDSGEVFEIIDICQETCSYRFISVQLVPFVLVKQGNQLLKGPVDRGLFK